MKGQPAYQEWVPILEGPLGDACKRVLGDLVETLSDPMNSPNFKGGVCSGRAGLAIFFDYLARLRPSHGYKAMAEYHLNASVENLAESTYSSGLYDGFTGIAWAVEHLQAESGEKDPNAGIDEFLIEFLSQHPWKGHYDLIAGLTGLGVYALERLPRPTGRMVLEQIIGHLDETKIIMDGGFTWHTAPEFLPTWQRKIYPTGYYNMGVAHGIPSIIALLGQTIEKGVLREKSMILLEGAVAWLLCQKNPIESPICFNRVISAGNFLEINQTPPRLAWCYQDLGLCLALLWASRSVGRSDWEEEALAIARKATCRDMAKAGDLDAGLCHGASGNAHLFNRLYQATREDVFRQTSLQWFQRTLEYRMEGEGVAGFRAFSVEAKQGPWVVDWSLLDGALGIALSLLGGLSTTPPDWDHLLAISVPPLSISGAQTLK